MPYLLKEKHGSNWSITTVGQWFYLCSAEDSSPDHAGWLGYEDDPDDEGLRAVEGPYKIDREEAQFLLREMTTPEDLPALEQWIANRFRAQVAEPTATRPEVSLGTRIDRIRAIVLEAPETDRMYLGGFLRDLAGEVDDLIPPRG